MGMFQQERIATPDMAWRKLKSLHGSAHFDTPNYHVTVTGKNLLFRKVDGVNLVSDQPNDDQDCVILVVSPDALLRYQDSELSSTLRETKRLIVLINKMYGTTLIRFYAN